MNFEMGRKHCLGMITCLCLLLLLSSCIRRDLILVVPDSYAAEDMFWIIENPQSVNQPEQTHQGALIYRFTENGNEYQTFAPFNSWQISDWNYYTESGQRIATKSLAGGRELVISGEHANELVIDVRAYGKGSSGEELIRFSPGSATMAVKFISREQ